jgi:hypothetical protein
MGRKSHQLSHHQKRVKSPPQEKTDSVTTQNGQIPKENTKSIAIDKGKIPKKENSKLVTTLIFLAPVPSLQMSCETRSSGKKL